MGVRLPAEYQEVEWIGTSVEQTGSPYIMTDYYSGSSPSAKFKFELLNIENGDRSIFGWLGDGNEEGFYFDIYSISQSVYSAVVYQRYRGTPKLPVGVYEVSLDSNAMVINDTSYSPTGTGVYNDARKLSIFGATSSSGGIQWNAQSKAVRVYYLKIFNDGVLGAEFIPCYRKSDSEPGMYDLVSKTFYTNQGTGDFLVGPDVVNHISPRLMDRRRALIAKLTSLFRKVITSQTGLVSFDTNVAKPMKVTCEFSPKQDLHGYDNPWPAGGGKNLFLSHAASDTVNGVTFTANSDGTVTVNGTATADIIFTISEKLASSPGDGSYCHLSDIGIVAGNSYILNGCPSGGNTGGYRLQLLVYGSGAEPSDSGTGSTAFTFSETDVTEKWYRLAIRIYNGTVCNNLVFKPMIRLSSVSDASYAPYENICPIEAWDGANVTGVGKNLINKAAGKTHSSYPRYIQFGVNNYDDTVPNKTIKLAAGQYTISMSGINSTVWESCAVFNETRTRVAISYNKKSLTFTLTSAGFYIVAITISSENFVSWDNYDIQLERGSTQTTYEPFMGTTLPIPFNNPGTYDFLPVQEGTGDPSPENIRPIHPGLTFTRDDDSVLSVYGGTLTVNANGTGSLVSNYRIEDVKANANSYSIADSRVTGDKYFERNLSASEYAESTVNIEQTAIQKEKFSCGMIANPWASDNNGYNCVWVLPKVVRVGSFGYNDIDSWKTYIAGLESVAIAYPLATPTTYTLSVAETSRAFEALGLGKNLGPLYGGTVTVNEDGSVDLVPTWYGQIVTKDTAIGIFPWGNIETDSTTGIEYARALFIRAGGSATKAALNSVGAMCDKLPMNVGRPSINHGSVYDGDTYGPCIALPTSIIGTTNETLRAYLAENEFKFVWPLRTPNSPIHFSSISELQSFLGTNNVWSDLNGAITVEYYKKQQ